MTPFLGSLIPVSEKSFDNRNLGVTIKVYIENLDQNSTDSTMNTISSSNKPTISLVLGTTFGK